jgi:hypothetical protein
LAASIALKAAIRRFRSSLPGIRQIRDRIHRHAFDELDADRPAAKKSSRSADDLTGHARTVEFKASASVATLRLDEPMPFCIARFSREQNGAHHHTPIQGWPLFSSLEPNFAAQGNPR